MGETLTVADIRAMVAQLRSAAIEPSGNFVAWVHPRSEARIYWPVYKFKAIRTWVYWTLKLDLSFDECMFDRPWTW